MSSVFKLYHTTSFRKLTVTALLVTMSLAEAQLARSLPLRLQKFFCLNPPRLVNGALVAPGTLPPQSQSQSATSTTPPPLPSSVSRFVNPFQPQQNIKTGRWHPPLYSLRRQADLVKLAKEHGVEDLLPPTLKSTEATLRRREEFGLRVKGTGAGQKVKGHEWERTLKGRLEKRRKAMLEMPNLVQAWKQVWSGSSMSPGVDANMVTSVVMVADGRSGPVERLVGIEAAFTGNEAGVETNLHHLGVQYGHVLVTGGYSICERLRNVCIAIVHYRIKPSLHFHFVSYGLRIQLSSVRFSSW